MSHALKLPEWQIAWVREAVAARCGLYLGEPHEAHLRSCLTARMQEMQLNFGDYARALQESPSDSGELQTLIERLCIHETSFFRAPNQFDALARFILPQLIRDATRAGRHRLRLVSAGCSTGQEAYSLAMLAGESLPAHSDFQIEVVGLDVSGDAIERASRGIYPTREVAPLARWRRERYFLARQDAYAVKPELRHAVRWLRWNLTGGLPVTQVDLVFCRNVLIYFQGTQRDAVVRGLAAALRHGGFLVVGHTDSLQAHRDVFETIHTNGTMVFQRTGRLERANDSHDTGQSISTAADARDSR